MDDLLEDKHHHDEDRNSDGADINDDQTDGGLLEQTTVTTDQSTEMQLDSPLSSPPPKRAWRQERLVSSIDKSLDPDDFYS